VAVVTASAGVAGAGPGVADSFLAQTPLVVIGAAAPELDQRSLFNPITKRSSACTDADRIPEHVATAFRHALAQPRGPVYLELPMDVLFAEADDVQAQSSRSTARTFGDPRAVMKAAEILNSAERPVVIAGSGIWWDGAWKQLAFFAENGTLPIFLAGGHGEHVERPDHLATALERAPASGEPAIVNVLLDPPAMTGRTHSGI
jgi:thiamine pyrophosphate-dependent acetolactate synthase large subunit-like protein